MSKGSSNGCSSCDRLSASVEEAKSKLGLLETRLKDVLRAYKLLQREKEALQAALTVSSSASSHSVERVDASQQRRIADLEETVLQLTTITGRMEVERSTDRATIARLEAECDRLREQDAQCPTRLASSSSTAEAAVLEAQATDQKRPKKELRNKACQTTAEKRDEVACLKASQPARYTEEKACQTAEEEFGEHFGHHSSKNASSRLLQGTAVVSPFRPQHGRRVGRSVSETVVDEEEEEEEEEEVDEDEDHDHQGQQINSSSAAVPPQPEQGSTSLFYVNELARRELELAEYKLRVREHECSIRELQWKYSNEKYRLQSRIADLELLNSHFLNTTSHKSTSTSGHHHLPSSSSFSTTSAENEAEATRTTTSSASTSTMSTVNVAYIRNVLTKLLETKDREQKAVMIRALLTALNSSFS